MIYKNFDFKKNRGIFLIELKMPFIRRGLLVKDFDSLNLNGVNNFVRILFYSLGQRFQTLSLDKDLENLENNISVRYIDFKESFEVDIFNKKEFEIEEDFLNEVAISSFSIDFIKNNDLIKMEKFATKFVDGLDKYKK